MMDKRDLIQFLLGIVPWTRTPGQAPLVPEYLEQKYARESAARGLGDVISPELDDLAALLRAIIADSEEDVREQSLVSLVQLANRDPGLKPILLVALVAATYDLSSKIRYTAIESLWAADRVAARSVAQRLASDEDQFLVGHYAQQILVALDDS